MKTKTNEIPLVGPKGRSELIKRINETNENVDSKFKAVEDVIAVINERLEKVEHETYKHTPFTIRSLGDGTLSWGLGQKTVQYSKNGGEWTTMNSESVIQLSKGDELAFKGSNTDYNENKIAATMNYDVVGNIMSLTDGDDFESADTINAYAFANMFDACDTIVSAKHLQLPITTLAERCYSTMFRNCTSLTTPPELPATTLADYCYANMFQGCTSLITAPELPAMTLTDYCYANLFRNCTSLTTAPKLPSTALADSCYRQMFYFCRSLTTAPELPATTLASNCYDGMFRNCSNLTTAPELPAAELVTDCYKNMFNGCSSLNYIKAMFTTTPSNINTSYWVSGVASAGKFVKNSAATWNVTGVSGIPEGWIVETANS